MNLVPSAPATPTRLTRALNLLMVVLQFSLGFAGYVFAGALFGVALQGWPTPWSTLVLALAFGFLAVCIHESGHWLGACWGRMTVLYVRIFALEFQLLKRGMRMRWSRRRKGQRFGGYVIAAHNPYQQWRTAHLRFVAMGPLANLLVAAACVVVALFTLRSSWAFGGCLLAFGAINLGMGLANLVPTARPLPSDGAQLLIWWRKPDQDAPAFAYLRLLSLSAAGVGAADLPAADLQVMAQQPMPSPLIHLAYRLEALLAAGDWAGAVDVEMHLEQLLQAHPTARENLASSIAILRTQLAFCRAMQQRSPFALTALELNRDIDWYAPTLAPLGRALNAALAGDVSTVERELESAAQIAKNSRVQSTYSLHLALAGHIRALL